MHGTGSLPDYYEEAFLCEALNLSYTELLKQPAEWVQSSIEYLGIKSDYDKAQIDKDSK